MERDDIAEYGLVYADGTHLPSVLSQLMETVNSAMAEGWTPIGGHSVTHTSTHPFRFYVTQTIVRTAEKQMIGNLTDGA